MSAGATCGCGGVHGFFHTAGSIGGVLGGTGYFPVDRCVGGTNFAVWEVDKQ